MALITDPKLIERLCVNVTPPMRKFCNENFANPQYPEEWLRGVDCPDPNTLPFTEAFWWGQIITAVPLVEDANHDD
jgi:hypothetical protein